MINQPYSSLLCPGEQHKYFHDSIWIQKESIIFRIPEWSFMRKCTSSTYQTCWIYVWGYPTKFLEAILTLSVIAQFVMVPSTLGMLSLSLLPMYLSMYLLLQTLKDIRKSYINLKLVSCASLVWIVHSPSNSLDNAFFHIQETRKLMNKAHEYITQQIVPSLGPPAVDFHLHSCAWRTCFL